MEISPNAFATELSRIIAANIGQRYLIIKLKIFFLRKVPPSATTSSSIFSTPTFLEIKRQVASAAIGIITELVRKSKKSRNCIPMIFTKPSGPYPREERVPRRIMITPTITVAFFLCHLQFVLEGRYSALRQGNRAGKSCAQHQYKEQNPDDEFPTPCWQIPLGMVMNISAGPACKVSGSPPENANTAGMIIRPAIMAMAVSKISTFCGGIFNRYVSFSYKSQR